jgi:predicted lipoprotein with Yx(FWY)xxD motif
MNDIKAARLLTVWEKNARKTVAVTKRDYDTLLFKVPPLYVAADSKTAQVVTVVLNKEKAIQFLKSEYNLYKVDNNGLRGDSDGESIIRHH